MDYSSEGESDIIFLYKMVTATMRILLLAFFCMSLGILQAQHDRQIKAAAAAPLGVEDAQMFDNMMVIMPGYGGSRESLERQSVKPYMMPVRETGRQGSDWSYALVSCLEYYVNRGRNYKDNLSPDFVALSLQNAGQTAGLGEGLKFLANTGTVSAAIMPYDAPSIPNAVFATNKYRITNYLHLFREQSKGRQKVFEVRKALMRGNPVITSFAGPANFHQFRGLDYRESGRKEFVYTLLVVGYDEEKEAFEVMSCQGDDWGNRGYAWIPYDTFGNHTINGYVMVPNVY